MVTLGNYIEKPDLFYLEYSFTWIDGSSRKGSIKKDNKSSLLMSLLYRIREVLLIHFDESGIDIDGMREMDITSFVHVCRWKRYEITTKVIHSEAVFKALRLIMSTVKRYEHEISSNGEVAA